MNVLFLSHRIPYPPNKGDKIRSFHQIRHLSGEHSLHLAFLVDDRRDLEHLPALKEYCVDYRYDVIDPKWKKLSLLPHLLTSAPLSVPYFYSARLQEEIDRLLDEVSFDCIFCFSSPMAEYLFRSRHRNGTPFGGARLIMDFVDVDSDKWRMYAGFSGFPLGTVYRREWRRLQEYEKRVGETFDWSLFVSEKEVELFRTFCPGARTMAIPNGVDTSHFRPVEQPAPAPPIALFMGAMDYYPNEDAVLYFADEIWPLVREKVPEARFVIAGPKPGPRVKALSARGEGIEVTGFVPDVRPLLAGARVFVAPFRIARGIQNKVLEAMAAGVPVVARPEAVQGLTGHNGSIRVEGEPASLARAVVDCLGDSDERQRMINAARDFILMNHDWERNLAPLGLLLESTA